MKLWLLRPRDPPPVPNPWDPWYDLPFGLVVRAESELAAREIAHGENPAPQQAWRRSNASTCVELTADGEPGVIIEDVHWA